ncbi:hypothetical protein JTE90_010588 [Oedothorax gibbosus]|uniref:Uncharacterized protein n=1 Tax=Oedothorax gibbosus TaxID=931172 RepID=A0AAV6V6C3_9ARAC|nr:hypothetical protein JTE90_010588 [Oedothorax gibbosus]
MLNWGQKPFTEGRHLSRDMGRLGRRQSEEELPMPLLQVKVTTEGVERGSCGATFARPVVRHGVGTEGSGCRSGTESCKASNSRLVKDKF